MRSIEKTGTIDLPAPALIRLQADDSPERSGESFGALNADNITTQESIRYQVIVDGLKVAAGHELMAPGHSPECDSQPFGKADIPELAAALLGDLERAARPENHKTFIRITPDVLENQLLDALDANSTVLMLQLDVAPDEMLLMRCRNLRHRGFSLALADYAGIDQRSRPLLSMLDIVEINLQACDAELCEQLAGSLASLPIKLLARGVNSRGLMESCRRFGFHLYQGTHIEAPERFHPHWLPVARPVLARLLERIDRHADSSDIEEALKKETALMFNLYCLPLATRKQISAFPGTFRHRIMSLGTHRLGCWLRLQMLASAAGPASGAQAHSHLLMQVAVLRGRMLELLVQRIEPHDSGLQNAAYLTGFLSTMPLALRAPLNTILQTLSIEAPVRLALLTRAGLLGHALNALEYFDTRDTLACEMQLELMSSPPLDTSVLNECFNTALDWLTITQD